MPVTRTKYQHVKPYLTKDGSTIRELMHPDHHDVRHQSLAEATIPPGNVTMLHLHRETEEIYHVTQGQGLMTLGEDQFMVSEGDTIIIGPGTRHCIENTGPGELKLLCSCSPAYSHEDTFLLD